MANASDLLILAGLIGGGLYLHSIGFFNNMLQDPRLPTNVEIFPSETKKDEEDKKVEVIETLPPQEELFGQQQPPPFQQQQQAYYPPQLNPRTAVGPPPGLTSSLYPMNVPMGPPYISGTVGTYSPYSPYNQFKVYEQYQTPGWGMFSTLPDDNITFSDIDITTNPYCYDCKANCMSNPYGSRCRRCRLSCKRSTHSYRPPQTGWTISPVNRPTAQVFLGMLADTVSRGATFAEMDDYSEKRRFDCHNHLKRRVKAKDNSFLTNEDY